MKKTKRSKKSRSWVIKQHRDQFYKKSKVLGYRARSAFKLIELNKKFKFIKNNCTLLDIGASPGGWSQISKEINNKGQIVAIDIKPMEKIEGVQFLQHDFMDPKIKNKILEIFKGKIDVIISDMAADTTGNKNLDCIRTNLLCAEVIEFATKILKLKGTLIAKLFMGEDFIEVKKNAKKNFKKVEFFKPESSRDKSKETYIHCNLLKAL
jgi:23S rRNA (uridine2552-2'-O)-methyltransferase|tara:strand:- start:6 stop:632 length:627 start_codon:yes stop_codon:yes gene_type:complete